MWEVFRVEAQGGAWGLGLFRFRTGDPFLDMGSSLSSGPFLGPQYSTAPF